MSQIISEKVFTVNWNERILKLLNIISSNIYWCSFLDLGEESLKIYMNSRMGIWEECQP